jgi:hypothetical protein
MYRQADITPALCSRHTAALAATHLTRNVQFPTIRRHSSFGYAVPFLSKAIMPGAPPMMHENFLFHLSVATASKEQIIFTVEIGGTLC